MVIFALGSLMGTVHVDGRMDVCMRASSRWGRCMAKVDCKTLMAEFLKAHLLLVNLKALGCFAATMALCTRESSWQADDTVMGDNYLQMNGVIRGSSKLGSHTGMDGLYQKVVI